MLPNGNIWVTTFTSVNSLFQGDLACLQNDDQLYPSKSFARRAPFHGVQTSIDSSKEILMPTAGGSVTFTKTEEEHNQWNGGNIFGVSSFINNSNAFLDLP